MVTLGDDLGMAVELVEPVGELAQRDQASTIDVRDLPLVRLADVQLARLEIEL